MHKLEFRLYILNLLRDSTHKVNVELKNFTYKPPGKGEEDKKNLPHTNTVSVHIKCVNVATIVNGSFSTLRNKLRFSHCFKYRPSRSKISVDISFFACCQYDMGKSFAHIICSKKWPIFEISIDKWLDMSRCKIG